MPDPTFAYDLPQFPQMPDADPELRKILYALAERKARAESGDELPPLPSLERKHHDNPFRNALGAIGDQVMGGQENRERRYDDAVQAQNLSIANRRNVLSGRAQDVSEAEERRKADEYKRQQDYLAKLLVMVDDPQIPASTKRELYAQIANLKTDPLHLAAFQTEGDVRQAGYREGLGDLYANDVKARGDVGQGGAEGTAVSNPNVAGPGDLPELNALTSTMPTSPTRPTFGTPPIRSLTNLQPVGAEPQQAPEPSAVPTSPMMRGRDPSFLPPGVPPMQMQAMTPVAGGPGPTPMPNRGPAGPSAFSMTDPKPIGSIGLNSLKIGADDLAGRPGVTFKTDEDIRQSKNSYHAPVTTAIPPDESKVDRAAQAVLSHQLSPSQAAAMFGGMGGNAAAFKREMNLRVLEVNPGFNFEQAEANYQFGKAPSVQGTIRFINNMQNTIPVMRDLVAEMKLRDVRVLNSAEVGAKSQFGSKAAARYEFAQTMLADELGKILTGGGTGSPVTDAKMYQALSILGKDMTPEQWDGVLDLADELTQMRKKSLTEGTFMDAPGGIGADRGDGGPPARPANVPANSQWVVDTAHPKGTWKARPPNVPDNFVWTVDPVTGKGMWKAPQ